MTTVGEDLPRQMARVRDLIPIYESIGPAGAFAVETIRVYESLKGYKS